MFDIMIKFLVFALWIGVFLALPSLFALRLYYVLKEKLKGMTLWLVLCLPFSLGVQYYAKKGKFKTLYDGLTIAFFVILLLGSFFLFYQYKSL